MIDATWVWLAAGLAVGVPAMLAAGSAIGWWIGKLLGIKGAGGLRTNRRRELRPGQDKTRPISAYSIPSPV